MNPDSHSTAATALLDAVRDRRATAERAEVTAMELAIAWLERVVAEGPASESPWISEMPIGGDGAPAVPEDAVAEFAAALAMAPHTARSYLADAWDLAWRFPLLHHAVLDGTVALWRARTITAATHGLNASGALFIDEFVTPQAHKIGLAKVKRFVIYAEAISDPDAALARAVALAESRAVNFYPGTEGSGLTDLVATLDHADAEDLEAAIAMIATEDSAAESLTVRRAQALGVLARRQLSGWTGDPDTTTTRVLHTYIHLAPGAPMATAESGPTRLLPVSQIADWCSNASTHVVITPVIDLNSVPRRDGYVPSRAMRDQAVLINATCVHPYCERPARDCDLDHIEPYQRGGPPGQTNTDNLAPLCRFHHRLKTHSGWSYQFLEPGYYLWSSPESRTYLRTPNGTLTLHGNAPPAAAA